MQSANTGLVILSKKIFGQWLITSPPQVIINGQIMQHLSWNNDVFVPLEPGYNHQIEVSFPYLGGNVCKALMVVHLHPGEVQRYRYRTAFFVFSNGKLTRTG